MGHLAAGRVFVVVSDIIMPLMNGMELLKKINQTWPCREVVMLTAEGSVEEAVDAMKQGASPVLSSRRILMR